MLWSACLTLIQDRIMASGRKLPDIFIVAASNQVASPGIIPASTRDRFMFIELVFDADHWCKWFERKHGVNPRQLADRIQSDSDQYNILTPRRVEKLYTWLKDNGGVAGRAVKVSIISSMFDAEVCTALMNMVNYVKTPQRQIKEAIDDMDIEGIEMMTDDFETMSLKEIMEYLQQQPEWDAIQDTLSKITLVEQEKEDIPY